MFCSESKEEWSAVKYISILFRFIVFFVVPESSYVLSYCLTLNVERLRF